MCVFDCGIGWMRRHGPVFLLLALEMNTTPHREDLGDDALTIVMTATCGDKTDMSNTASSRFGFHVFYYLEWCRL